MANELLERNQVEERYTWRLEDLYENIEDFNKDLDKISKLGDEIAAFEGKVCESANNLLQVLEKFTESELVASRLFNYAERLYDQDTGNNDNLSLQAKVYSVYSDIGSKVAFVDPEILALDEEKLEEFYSEAQGLSLYREYIKETFRMKAHTLSAELEKVVAMTFQMSQTPSDTYSILTNADMTFPETKDENGELVRITNGRFVRLLESANRDVRKDTFEKYYSEFKKLSNTCASLFNGQITQQMFNAKVRNYESALQAAVHKNNVSEAVYHNLIESVNKNLDKLHRYVSVRKKCLGVDELHMYDIYTPMIPDAAKSYSYDEAQKLVLEALKPLGEEYLKVVREAFDGRWIDVYENKGKRSGAYSATAYGVHPYMLLNYNESLDDVFTLIHEMGHSMHSYYSDRTQPFIYSQYKIFVAEVASTVNEVLLLEHLLANTTEKNQRAYLLNHYLDMFKGTLFRQTQFAEFELETNKIAWSGDNLSSDVLNDLYLSINKKYYGDDIVSDDEIALEWARIPHFYYNFYVYQYATSFSAAVAIAHEILEKGQPVVDKYINFLSSGCSKSPVELLKIVGVDMETAKPFDEALEVMSTVLDSIEELI